jgi:type VI secretion system secreted protein VgrG
MAYESVNHPRRHGLLFLTASAAVAVAASMLFFNPPASAAEPPVGLGTAANFSVLAGSTVTNTGPTTMQQSLGVHPGNAAPGFPPGLVGDETHLGGGVALQAKNDLTTAFNSAAGRTPFTNVAAELGGTTLIPGVYRVGAAQLTGALTLNAQGNSQSVFIFQVDSTLTTAPASSVVFINGASPCNVFWKIGSSATLDTGTSFVGTIMASISVTMKTGAVLEGRALASSGAVTLDTNDITEPVCIAATTTPTTTPTGTAAPTGSSSPTTGSGVTPAVTATSGRPTDSTSTGDGEPPPPDLPLTGGDRTAALLSGGSALIILGAAFVILLRRRSGKA